MIPEDIVKGCLRNDAYSQKWLYEKTHPIIYPVAKRYSDNKDEMYDIVSDSFLKIYKNVKKVNTLNEPEAWMRKVTSNTAIDHLRKKIKHKERYVYLEDQVLNAVNKNENLSFEQMNYGAKEVFYCLSILPVLQRTVFNMYVMDGYTHKEIAQQLNIQESNSRWNLYDAKKRLKQELEVLVQRLAR